MERLNTLLAQMQSEDTTLADSVKLYAEAASLMEYCHAALEKTSLQIDEIDAKMAALFEQRMQAVGQVAQYKARTGKQVFDPAREALVLEKNTARVQNPELQPYYREFLKKALAVSRAYQHVLIGQDVAAYQGVEGAWSHIALRQLFPFAKAQACSTWNEVVEAVERGDAYCGVLPFENSNAGDVSAVLG